eukprot:scaffold110937_cov36-Phaeocystis_antarctica.AAC.1
MAPSRLHQRHRMPGTAPRCDQPRAISLLGRASRPYRPCFPHNTARARRPARGTRAAPCCRGVACAATP